MTREQWPEWYVCYGEPILCHRDPDKWLWRQSYVVLPIEPPKLAEQELPE
jgi:hypothetical protein